MPLTPIDYEALRRAMDSERDQYMTPLWRDLADFILPKMPRFLSSDRNNLDKRNSNIVDSTATFAARTLAFGMMSSVTSPSRPWFVLGLEDFDLMEYGPVRQWLSIVTQRMRDTMLKSNIYTVLPNCYLEMGVFGTSAFGMYEDKETILRAYPYPIGSYSIGADSRLKIDSLSRTFQMSAKQIVERFGAENVSDQVRSSYERSLAGGVQYYDVTHVICPNADYVKNSMTPNGKKWSSVYYETGQNGGKFLKQSGHDRFPALVSRWSLTGEDVWGSSPAMDCHGDIRGLQLLQKNKARAIEKQVNPPLVGPPSLQNKSVSLLPGKITYDDSLSEKNGLRPIHDVRFDIQGVVEDVSEHHSRIKQAFYSDLFLMLTMTDRREITAREVEERHQEKLIVLGPVLERLNDELLDPLVDHFFDGMLKGGLIPTPPKEIQGADLKVEYISVLAQAQKLTALAGVDRLVSYAGTIAAVKPEVLDKIDFDQTIDEYADKLGVSPGIVRDDSETLKIRQAREQQIMAMQQAQANREAISASKELSETNTGNKNALTDILGGEVAGVPGS